MSYIIGPYDLLVFLLALTTIILNDFSEEDCPITYF